MLHLLILCTLMVVREGQASHVPEDLRFVPVKDGETPACAKDGRNYCEDDDNYPKETILKLLKTTPPEVIDIFFTKDQPETKVNGTGIPSANDNLSGTVQGQICDTEEHHITIRLGRTLDNEWRYVVNVEERKQIVTVMTCLKAGKDCNSYIDTYTVTGCCEQLFIAYSVLALHPSGEKLYPAHIKLPSCCQCTLYTKESTCPK